MAFVPIFSNKPRFAEKQLSLNEILTLQKFNAMTESSLENSSANNITDEFAAACGDPNLGTTFRKNVVRQAIYTGGSKRIHLNWFREMFGSQERMVDTKRFWNHYIRDTTFNMYAAATVTGTAAGGTLTFQVLKQNHGSSGTLNLAAKGYSLWDKDNQIEYIITDVDYTIPYANKVTIQPLDGSIVPSIKAGTPYFITLARRVGGDSEKDVTNQMSTIGFAREVNFLRFRRDWEVTITDLLAGYRDKIQFPVIYNQYGEPMDSWDVYEAMAAREGLQMAINQACWIGSPATNQALISGLGAVIDQDHVGFYGLLPSIKYGGGIVYDYNPSVGFDLESDGEPIFLWQDSQKRTTKWMVLQGLQFDFNKNDRANKLVQRTGVGSTVWEAYKRLGTLSDDYQMEMAKLGVSQYKYNSFDLDFVTVGAWSDERAGGSSYYSNLAILVPQDGATENGRPINPIEFYQYGQNQWTGDYFESYVDNRYQTVARESLQGYCAQSIAFTLHAPDLFILLNPVFSA